MAGVTSSVLVRGAVFLDVDRLFTQSKLALRFALVESDSLPVDVQLALFARLPLPIAAILTSGAGRTTPG